jgi:outer membrane protein assembly factor BamB
MDKNRDGAWTREEFVGNFGHGSGKPLLIAVKPGGRGDVTESHLAWEHNRGIPEIPSPLYHAGRVYMVRSGGILTAVHAGTGKALYTERLNASGQYSASPILANGHLYLISEPGQLTVVKAGDELSIVHQIQLGDKTHVTPAFDDDTIYVRSEQHLWAFRK